ncbi:4018_t:CDS:2, partial [Gigaspora margarita]
MTKPNSRFVASTKEDIIKIQQVSQNKNTDRAVVQWMALFDKLHQLHGFLNEIIKLDNKMQFDQLEQFLVEVCKSNGQEYKASSLYTGFCAIARGISEALESIYIINMFDNKNHKQLNLLESEEIKFLLNSLATLINSPIGLLYRVWIWLSLLCCLKEGDAKRLKASWLSELSN